MRLIHCMALKNRVIKPTFGQHTVEAWVGRGCPQRREMYFCLGYADNIVIVVRIEHLRYISERIQKAMNIVDEWCRKQGQSTNPQKTSGEKED